MRARDGKMTQREAAERNMPVSSPTVARSTVATADPIKQAIAARLNEQCRQEKRGRLSWQVLNEFYVNATGKLGLDPISARKRVSALVHWGPVEITAGLLERSWYWSDQAGLSHSNSLIVAAAERAGCRTLYTEDLAHGRVYGIVEAVNPFLAGQRPTA